MLRERRRPLGKTADTYLLFNQRVAFFPRKVISAVPVEKGQYLKTGSVSGQHSVFQAIIPSRGNPKFALKCFLLTVPERLSCAGVCNCTLTAACAAQEIEGGVKEGKKKKRKQMICVYAGEVKSCYFLQGDFRSLLFTHETNKQKKTSSQCHQSASSASHRKKKKKCLHF